MEQEYEPINTDEIDLFVQNQFPQLDTRIHNRIEQVHPQINFFYNSLNISIGPQGCGKTTFLCKELIKLSRIQNHLYNCILYVSAGDTDVTFENLKKCFSIPVFKATYDKFYTTFQEYLKRRDPKDFHHTFIIFEDAGFIFTKDNDEWNNIITRLRHLRCTLWLNLHIWRSVSTMFKTQVTCLFIFKGYSREQVQQMYRQSCVAEDFKFFYVYYTRLEPGQCLKVNNYAQKIATINI